MGYKVSDLKNFSAGDYVEIKDNKGMISNGVIYPCTSCGNCGIFQVFTNSKLPWDTPSTIYNPHNAPELTYVNTYEMDVQTEIEYIKLIS